MSGDGDHDRDRDGDREPMADLAEEVRRRESGSDSDSDSESGAGAEAERDALDELEDAFREVEVGEVDEETVWESLAADDDAGSTAAVDPPQSDTDEGRDVRVIPKSTCHTCRFFADPPAMGCTHEGTEIREMVDVDRYEVVDCPMVVDTE